METSVPLIIGSVALHDPVSIPEEIPIQQQDIVLPPDQALSPMVTNQDSDIFTDQNSEQPTSVVRMYPSIPNDKDSILDSSNLKSDLSSDSVYMDDDRNYLNFLFYKINFPNWVGTHHQGKED